MTHLSTPLLIGAALIWLGSCFPDDYDRCGEGYRFERNDCIEIKAESNTGLEDDAGIDDGTIRRDRWIGSACRCEGEECSIAGIPNPNQGLIIGCEDVPDSWPGASIACMRTYAGEFIPPTYYAQGFCTLLAWNCTGDDLACITLTKGDYQTMTACPENTVMVTTSFVVDTSGVHADFDQKICAPVCSEDRDCRADEYDEVLDKPGQYRCVDSDGIGFCLDPRNLSDDYTVEAF